MDRNELLLSGARSFMEENYQTSVETFSKLITQFHAPEGYLYRATANIRLGNYEEAIKDLNEGEQKSSNSYEFSYQRGIALFYLERFAEAHDNFVRAALVATSPDQRSNLDRWMSKTRLECPNIPTNIQTSQTSSTSNENKQNTTTPTSKNEEQTIKVDPNAKQTTSIQSGISTSTNQNNYKHQWFQNPNYIFLTINTNSVLDKNQYDVVIDKRTLIITRKDSNIVVYDLHLCNSIEPKQSTYEFKENTIFFNLKKEIEGFNWVTIEKEKLKEVINESQVFSSYPTSAKVKKNWDQIDKELDKEMTTNPESNDAMMTLFRQIYEKGDEKTRTAMKKSFQTSGGTVLSTNWEDVKDKDYEGKDRPEPPKGQEWAKY